MSINNFSAGNIKKLIAANERVAAAREQRKAESKQGGDENPSQLSPYDYAVSRYELTKSSADKESIPNGKQMARELKEIQAKDPFMQFDKLSTFKPIKELTPEEIKKLRETAESI